MQYQVKQKFGQNSEKQIAEFGSLKDAKIFVEEKLSSDAMYKVNAIYRIYHFDEEIVEEWNQEKWQKIVDQQQSGDSSSSSAGGAGAQSQSSFRPTPLPTSPRPPGMPASSFRESDKEKDDERGNK